MKWHWLLASRSVTWHAWAGGAGRSLCGALTRDDLSTHPALKILPAPPAALTNGEKWCVNCSRKSAVASPTPAATLGGAAGEWLGFLRRHCRRAHVHLAETDEHALALRLTALGSPEDAEACALFEQIRDLLLTPRFIAGVARRQRVQTIVGLKDALAVLPSQRAALVHIAGAMRAWRRITGRAVGPTTRFNARTVISTMLEIPAPEAWITHLKREGVDELAMLFHPNSLARHRKDAALRGVFGGGSAYWDKTAEQLEAQIVTD